MLVSGRLAAAYATTKAAHTLRGRGQPRHMGPTEHEN